MTIIEKRTYDNRLYDIVCADLLDDGETIVSVVSVADDDGTLTFGTAAINTAAMTYPNNLTVQAGKVIQVKIGGGAIVTGKYRDCICRARFVTSLQNDEIEATFIIRLIDTPE